MAQIPVEVKNTIEKYLNDLRENHVPIRQAILFGSHAHGTHNAYSDIDIALVSDIFQGNRIEDKDKIRHITLAVSSEIEVLPFAPNDFHEENPLAKEIMTTGIPLL